MVRVSTRLTMPFLLLGWVLFFTAFFAPATTQGYATSGDGVTQGLPTFFARNPLWEPRLMLGYPLFADPNQAYWYPLLRLLRAIPGSFNAYVIAPYVIAAFGVSAFARRMTGSTSAGVVAGLVFSLGGFMISHQGHLNLIHPAAWSAMVLWAVEERRHHPSFVASAGGAVALAIGVTSGSQQPLVYVASIALVYGVVLRPRRDRRDRTYLRDLVSTFVLGLSLSAIAIVPAIELTLQSTRAVQTYGAFTSFATMPLEFPIRAVFPFFLGASESRLYAYSHLNVGAFSEASNYVGFLPIMLTALALYRSSERRQVTFWSIVAIWAIWMSLGDAFLAARLAYSLPVYGLFRIPGRHAIEWTLAISILAAWGVTVLEQNVVRLRDSAKAAGSVVVAVAACFAVVTTYGTAVRNSLGAKYGVTVDAAVPLELWRNLAIGVPLADLLCSVVLLLLVTQIRSKRLQATLIVLAVMSDLSTFAVFSYWRFGDAQPSIFAAPPEAVALRSRLARAQRLLAVDDARIQPNLSELWNVPTTNGYVSLEDSNVASLLDVDPDGTIPPTVLGDPSNSALDISGTGVVTVPRPVSGTVPVAHEFASPPLGVFIGTEPLTERRTVAFGLSRPFKANALDLVTALGESMAIPNLARVAELVADDDTGRRFVIPILAGRDSSESAFDRPDVHPLVRHRRALIYSGGPAAHLYRARLSLPTTHPIVRLFVRWQSHYFGALSIEHLALVNTNAATAYPLQLIDAFNFDRTHWRANTSGSNLVLTNLRAAPNAWAVLISRSVSAKDETNIIKQGTSVLEPRPFDAASAVLVTDADHAFSEPSGTARVARSTSVSPMRAEFSVSCSSRCMLVQDDLSYPGWHASIDGKSAPIVRVDIALRGVDVPAGAHAVRIWFAPASLYLGALISCLAMILIIALYRPRRENTSLS